MLLMTLKKFFPNTLKKFAKEIGVAVLIVDLSGEQTSQKVSHLLESSL